MPEKFFTVPEFLTRHLQILQMGERSPSLHPCLLQLWFISSSALHLIAERLASVIADTSFKVFGN